MLRIGQEKDFSVCFQEIDGYYLSEQRAGNSQLTISIYHQTEQVTSKCRFAPTFKYGK
jgi:hypothetical protein